MTTDDAARAQWETAGNLLARWRNRARLNQDQHWEATKYFQQLHYLVGVPVVALSAIVGTTVFATLQKQVGLRIQLVVGGISLLAAVLAGLQTFLGFSARAEQHKSVASAYGAVRRRLETLVTLPVELRGNLADTVKQIELELDNLAKAAPTVPNSIYRSVQKRLAADLDTWPETRTYPPVHPFMAPGAYPAAAAVHAEFIEEYYQTGTGSAPAPEARAAEPYQP
jgi:hypothetical protein